MFVLLFLFVLGARLQNVLGVRKLKYVCLFVYFLLFFITLFFKIGFLMFFHGSYFFLFFYFVLFVYICFYYLYVLLFFLIFPYFGISCDEIPCSAVPHPHE